MTESVNECKNYIPITNLKLVIWQRELFCRPYDTLVINRKHFLEKLGRALDQNDVDLISEFVKSHKIKNFEISYCDCENLCLKQLLTSMENLTVLCLININLSSDNLFHCLNHGGPFTLKVIRLTGNRLSNRHCNHLRDFLIENRYMQYLEIGFCGLTHSKLAVILDGVYQSRSIKGLDISRIVPEHEFGNIDTEKICLLIAILLNQNKLEELHMKHCGLNGHDIEPMLEYLESRNCLKYLDLGSNNIGHMGTKNLMWSIRKGVDHGNLLTGLDISNNKIGKDGGEVLVQTIQDTKIRYLDIGRNEIPSDVMNCFLENIRKPYDLKILNIIGNEFDHQCAKILNRYLRSNTLLLNSVDVDVTFDPDKKRYLVVPQKNTKWSYSERYHRVFPFHQNFEWTLAKKWKRNPCLKEKCDAAFVDPILVDESGQVYNLNKNGEIKLMQK